MKRFSLEDLASPGKQHTVTTKRDLEAQDPDQEPEVAALEMVTLNNSEFTSGSSPQTANTEAENGSACHLESKTSTDSRP